MNSGVSAGLVVLLLLVIFVIILIFRTIRIVPQQTSLIIERLGRFSRTLEGGLHFLVPFVDKVRANVDLREQVVSFPPQPVITSDNLVVSIDTVIYYSVIDAKSAVYEIANFIQGIEQLTVTTLRNVIGSLDLEQTLTSRDQINGQLRGVLDEATGKWGIRVNRVELKAIDPPHSVQDSMEKQMRAERDRRAAILTAEGVKQSAILTAEGEKQSQILRAEGSAQAAHPRGAGPVAGDHPGVRGDPPRQAGPEAARLPVPPDAAAARARGLQQAVDHPERAHRRAQGHRQRPGRHQPRPARPPRRRTRGSTPARPCTPRSTTPSWRTRPGPWPRPATRRPAPAPRPRATPPASPAGAGRARPRATQGDGGPVDPPASGRPRPQAAPPAPPTLDGPVQGDPEGPARS